MGQLKLRNRHAIAGASVEALAATAFPTELGWMAIAFCGDTVVGVVFGHASQRSANAALRRFLRTDNAAIDVLEVEDCPRAIADLTVKLTRYALGEFVDFRDVVIGQQHLTSFGRRVVAACRRIPAGQTRTYGQLAAVCGSPGAARAVGQVMARNRYPLIVPCHRVVGSSGSLGGFSAPQGIAMKRRMLSLETQPN